MTVFIFSGYPAFCHREQADRTTLWDGTLPSRVKAMDRLFLSGYLFFVPVSQVLNRAISTMLASGTRFSACHVMHPGTPLPIRDASFVSFELRLSTLFPS